jgi:Ca-activated chloride channel homolog
MLRTLILSVVLSCLSLAPAPAAQERILPAGVRMTQLGVHVTVVDGVASTTLKQTWHNDGGGEAEAVWVLPLPPGAVADGFTLTINGVPTAGEVLGDDAARGVYESIVRSRRDPGLLEYFGRGCLRARIFPIPPRGDSQVEIGFRSVLPELLGLRQWSFALRAAGAQGLAPERIVLDLALRSRKPIKNAYAPLSAIQVVQKGDHEVRASFEGSAAQLAGNELALFYGLSEAEFGLDLLAHRAPGEAEGTFLMLLSPKREWQEQEKLAKSIVFVLDTSGSMEGAKIVQAKNALRLFLQSLTPDDRFDVVPFATEPEPFFGQRVPATPEKIAEALTRTERIVAAGGTNIDGALAAALRSQGELEGRVPIVVFLTDGEPTVGVTAPDQILAAARAGNAGRARIFVLGVGAELNAQLLDKLAGEHGGARDYVRGEERIDEKARALFAKLSHPVMTDVALVIDGLAPTKLVPAQLPDLFAGDRIELFGRYAGEGAHAIRLSGVVKGVRREYVYEATFPRESAGELAFLGALWAERRVGVLLDAIRLNGVNPELVAEVERLGREYRIVTPYTSHLVLEPGMRVATGGGASRPGAGGGFRGPGDTLPPGGPTSPGPVLTPSELDALRGLGYSGGPAALGVATSPDGFFLGSGARREGELVALATELKLAGVLPPEADGAELARLVGRVSRELATSESRWDALGKSAAGQQAVDDSQYLAQLVAGRRGGDSASLLELFTRRVQDKTFVLRGGVWIDASIGETLPVERRTVEAYSGAYFALLAERPALAPYLALSTRLVVRLGGDVFEIVEPRAEADAGR